MKNLIVVLGCLISLIAFNVKLLGNNYELTELGDGYVLVKILGQSGNYATYLYKGDINDIQIEAFISGELSVDINSRDKFEENIDLGVLPSDIYYDLHAEEPYVAIYGGNQVRIHDGGNHAFMISAVYLDDNVSNFNMAFVPAIPYRYQLTSVTSPIDPSASFLFCAPEGGGLYIIDRQNTNQFVISQQFNDNSTAQLLSSSIISDVFGNYLIWAINYWDGTCKIKLIEWNSSTSLFEVSQERSWNDEIIDFCLDGNLLRVALLNQVLEIEPLSLADVNQPITGLSIDKLEIGYGHIHGVKALSIFSGDGTYELFNSGNMIDLAFGSCFDPDSSRVYFSGHDSDPTSGTPGFRIINYKPGVSFEPFPLPGAISLAFNSNNSQSNEFYTVCAAGENLFVGFDDDGMYKCNIPLYCHSGYRIAIDLDLESNESNGTLIACLKDGKIVQFRRMECQESEFAPYFTVGISSSLLCYDSKNKEVLFFYNGDGANSEVFKYNETSEQTSSIDLEFDGTYTDCIYNEKSDLVMAGIYHKCEDYDQLVGINNDNFSVDFTVNGKYRMLTNYDQYIYCQKIGDATGGHKLYRFWADEEFPYSEYIELDYNYNSIEINEADGLLYLSAGSVGIITEVQHDPFVELNTYYINIHDDMAYNSSLEKTYVTQYNNQKVEVYNNSFNYVTSISVNGNPKKVQYNSFQNCIYVISDSQDFGFNIISTIDCQTDQVIKEKQIRRSDAYLYDNINDQLYFHTNYPSSENEMEYNVKSFNGFDDEFSNKINTQIYSYADIFLNKKRTIPAKMAINHKDNFIYVGNYGSSMASKIKAYDETFTFKPGWNWLSFPRLERYKDEPFDAIPLLERIDPWPPNYLEMEYKPSNISLSIFFDIEEGWNTSGQLTQVKSTLGYKLKYIKDIDYYKIRLEGAKEDYDASIDMVTGENWIGYFLDEPYLPEHCIPAEVMEHVWEIRTQYWAMIRIPGNEPPWYIKGKVTPFKYGDLVVIKTDADIEFTWQPVGNADEDADIPKTTYYTFEEQADYLPFYVETDSVADILEIALLADGEVVGAAVRGPGDTLVEVNAYLEGVDPGAVMEFETWDGYKSEAVEKGGYVVIDHKQKVREKRNIYAGERARYYHVSLRDKEVFSLPSEISSLNCRPNPFRQQTEFSFQLNKAGNVSLNIYDLTGKLVKPIINGDYPEGYYRFTWQGENEAGNQITPGVYFYKLSTGKGCVFSDKIVVVR